MILDSDILIWYFRGNENATEAVTRSMPFSVSIVTYMELLQGMRNKQELIKMKLAFKGMNVSVLPITEAISYRAAEYVEAHVLSNSVKMDDALIASTCVENGEMLYTANDKHYKAIEELSLKVFRP